MRHDAKLPELAQAQHPERIFQFPDPTPAIQSRSGPHSDASRTSDFVDQLLDLHEYERKRIGQELHDSTGQLLVSLQLSVARLRAIGGHNQESVINEIQATVREIDQEIRALAFLHYPAELRGRTLCEAVRSLVHGFGSRTGIRTTFKSFGEQTDVAEPISIALLRVAQEALVNIHRHSNASTAKVTLDRQIDRLFLTVSDNGIGIPDSVDDRRGPGIGLKGMRHRVELHGGRLQIRNLKHGTKVSATIPLVA